MPRKNPAAVALGRKGGKANTEAQDAARRSNGARGGRPVKPLPCECQRHAEGWRYYLPARHDGGSPMAEDACAHFRDLAAAREAARQR